MKDEFRAALQHVVDQTAPGYQEDARIDVDSLLDVGAASVEDLVKVLNDPSAGENRARACWVLSRMSPRDALAPVLSALGDPDPQLRAEAARSLAAIGSLDAVPYLVRTLQCDPDQSTRMGAAASLADLGDRNSVEPLLKVVANTNESSAVRGAAAEALAHTFDSRAISPLIAALSDDSAEVRFWAAFALGELGDTAALSDLQRIAAMDEGVVPDVGSVRQEAAAAIESIRAATTRPLSD